MNALLLCAALSASPGWDATFPPEVLASYLDGDGHGVLVVAAGEGSRGAAEAVIAALRGSGRTRFVMDDASLGNLNHLADPQILERARPSPVDVVATVRVFPGSGDEPATAVVTFYENPRGAVLAAASGPKGKPIAARQQSGVSANALQTVSEIGKEHAPREAPPPSQNPVSPQGTYEARFLWFRHAAGESPDWEPLQGRVGYPLDPETFLARVGRVDLVTRYNSRRMTRVALWLVGGGAITIGGSIALLAAAGVNCARVDASTGACLGQDGNLAATGYILMGAGVLTFAGAFFISPYPVNASEAEKMANDYNEKLKGQLGVSERERPRSLEWGVGPVPVRGGAGAGVWVSL